MKPKSKLAFLLICIAMLSVLFSLLCDLGVTLLIKLLLRIFP
nr:MAG TPA_asm: hypothetical protein [Caudoviricetes sp.]